MGGLNKFARKGMALVNKPLDKLLGSAGVGKSNFFRQPINAQTNVDAPLTAREALKGVGLDNLDMKKEKDAAAAQAAAIANKPVMPIPDDAGLARARRRGRGRRDRGTTILGADTETLG